MSEYFPSDSPKMGDVGGSKPVEGVRTDATAFIGYARSGEFNHPTQVRSWDEFKAVFGESENAFLMSLCQELNAAPVAIRASKRASGKSWIEFTRLRIENAISAGNVQLKSYGAFLESAGIGKENLGADHDQVFGVGRVPD